MKMETKQEVFARYEKEYCQARVVKGGRKILTKIIDTVRSVTGMGRKSIIRTFNRIQKKDPYVGETRGRPLYYTPDVTVALKEIWETGSEVCGELLHPMVKEYIHILKRDTMWKQGDETTRKLLTMSEGTMKNRIGNFVKARGKGRGLSYIKSALPWEMLEVHPDTGSEFINWHLKGWCDMNGIAMTRSRPNHKNDNANVEERNGHIVRKYIGYVRLDCPEAVDALNDVYAILNPYLNHFVASKRLLEKYEVSGKWKKRYEPIAKTPYQRVLENGHISNEVKEKLKQEHEKLNPLVMKKEIDRLKKILYDTEKKYGTTEF